MPRYTIEYFSEWSQQWEHYDEKSEAGIARWRAEQINYWYDWKARIIDSETGRVIFVFDREDA